MKATRSGLVSATGAESRAETAPAPATVVRLDSNHGSSPCYRGDESAPGRSVQPGTGRP